MITASCQFCEDVRKEASGQETVVGLYDGSMPIVCKNHLVGLYALVTIHADLEAIDTQFSVRVLAHGKVFDTSPSEALKKAVLDDTRDTGLATAVFPVEVNLLTRPIEVDEETEFKIFLVVDGKDMLIGTFTAQPPEGTSD